MSLGTPARRSTEAAGEALRQETHLASSMVYSGITSLRAAQFDHLGKYFEAFFALTVGLERLAKLILVVDENIRTSRFPSQQTLRGYGHDLGDLYRAVDGIVSAHALRLRWSAPEGRLENEVLDFLSDYASARVDRYYNLGFLEAAGSGSPFDGPPARWVRLVSSFLTERQMRLRPNELRVLSFYAFLEEEVAIVTMFSDEAGDAINNTESALMRQFLNSRVQKVGGLACIHIARYLADVLRALGNEASSRGFEVPDFWEYFVLLLNDDSMLTNRKRFE